MKKRLLLIIGTTLLCIFAIIVINFIPTCKLKTNNMTKIEGNWINVYYENEKEAAEDVFNLADKETGQIANKLGFSKKENVNIYIYDQQNTMQKKKYGLIGPMLGLDWYIGDNIGTDVILTSPANPGPAHDYHSIKNAVVHEIIHAYISVKNPNIQLWLTEGMALYLSNGEPFYKDILNSMEIPTYSDTKTRNPIRFSNCGGYTFAHTYIEYLDVTYGWDKVCELIVSEDYEGIFNKKQEDIYYEWVEYIYNYYQ